MREILFKAKRICSGEWVEGFVARPFSRNSEGNITNYCFNALDEMGFVSECIVSADTICQYTGLTDKNGNKIWENDVVEGLFLYGAKVSAIVAFENGAFGLTWSRGNVEEFSPFTSICNVSFEVIGNIFSGYTKH